MDNEPGVVLGSQAGIHPILQQIDHFNNIYGAVPLQQGGPKQPQITDLTDHDDFTNTQNDGVHEAVSSEIFSVYEHREIVPGCQPHPGDIVEAGPLAALQLPEATYPLADSIPKDVIKSSQLSSLQLEGVLYACQRHQMILPDGRRAGFFIGDAAGVGKGRQISGIILDNYARGRTKHIWFTISSDLIVDSRRDLSDIGCYIKVIDGCQELDRETRVLGLPADFKEGVVFSTYATLVSSIQRGSAVSGSKKSRLQQLVDWCGGENYDGCLIFDECHKAKNFVPGKENTSTKVAMAVTSIQRLLPKARVVYCSATGVSDVKNMAFMERLGLWGEGAPFRTFEQFLDSVQRKGLGMAEMVAMEMKTSGMYVSRGLSFKQAEFVTIEAPLTKEQKKVYDVAAHVWNELRKALESAVVRTNYSSGRIWQQFWSSHQRFFKQLCIGMKVPTIIKETQEALDSGHCVVIGLQTTGEASLESEIGKNKGSIDGFVSLCREILTRFVTQHFPVMAESKNGDPPSADEWSIKAKELLLGFAKQISLPDSPLDEIIDKLGGPRNVAEMTGRKGRIVRHSPTDKPHYENRSVDVDAYGGIESLNVSERNQFMEGKKLVAIISDAASTGISLHADTRAKNQRRRVHLTVELPWSADKAVQQLGRSHRSNQSSGPLYKLLTTDLGGERRFAAAVARRLQSLGALTKGDRRAATGADLTEFNFDTPYGRNALRAMYHNICHKQIVPGISISKIVGDQYNFDEFNMIMQECLVLMGLIEVDMLRSGAQLQDRDTGAISKFLNRIFGLSVTKQNMIFTYFMECMNQTVENAKNEGRYNEGMLDITASSVKLIGEPHTLFKDLTKGHGDTRLVNLEIDRGMSWDSAMVRFQNHNRKDDGFYKSKREMFGKTQYLLATLKENSTHVFRIARPNTGLSQFEEEKGDLLQRYTPVSPDKAEKGWQEQYERTKNQCMHGTGCKTGRSCKVGSRCYSMHLLCGSIVTIMSVLESTLNRFAAKLNLSKSEATIRVVRVKLDDGERVVGIRYPELLIPEVEKVLKEQNAIEKIQRSQMSLSQSQTGQVVISNQDTEDNCPIKTLTIEPVAPVNEKCLCRALRPPVTIKNFFKPTKQKTATVTKSDSVPEKQTCRDVKEDVTLEQNVKREECSEENKICETEKHTRKASQELEGENKNIKSKTTSKEDLVLELDSNSDVSNHGSETGNRQNNKNDTKEIDNNINQTKKQNSATGLTSIKSRKRPAEEASSSKPNKRAKQVTIFSSFAKVEADKKVKVKKAASCPICGKEFEIGTSNADINSHIDNCLIE